MVYDRGGGVIVDCVGVRLVVELVGRGEGILLVVAFDGS